MSGNIAKLHENEEFDPETMLLVFTHIPKSGGTSFHAALKTLTDGKYCHLIPGQNDPDDIDALWGVGGHFDFESPAVNKSRKKRVYVSLLRHPIDRYLSFYKHVITRPDHHIAVANPEVLEMSPLEFAKTLLAVKNREIANLQCRMIAGGGAASSGDAIETIERHFSFCAPLTSQQQIVDQIANWFHSETVPVQRLNVAKAGVQVQFDDQLVGFLSQINAEDVKLFEFVERSSDPVG